MADFIVSEKRKKVWEKEIELFDAFMNICNKHNLSYCAIAGTLLGAVRHNDFIPWDDDIDVAMPRKDYDIFLSVAGQMLESPYFLQTPDTDKGYCYGHAKIRNTSTTAIRKDNWRKRCRFNQGIFIDIFPLDNVPNNRIIRWLYLKLLSKMHSIEKISEYYHEEVEVAKLGFKIKYSISRIIVRLFGKKNFNHFYNFCLSLFKRQDTKECGLISETTKLKDIWNRENFESYSNYMFHGLSVPVPCGYEEILRIRYGKWEIGVQEMNEHGDVFYDLENSYIDYLDSFSQYQDDNYYVL
ncbi:MAG: LicD family protein [Saccharofermentans sp.]|nr:LicD family protein [Saccharofermentans sp.]